MKHQLYRSAAIDHHREKLWGGVLAAKPVSFSVLTWTAVAIAIAIGCFLLFGKYTRKVSVQGYIEPVAGVVKLAAPGPGVLTELKINDGEKVYAGNMVGIITLERFVLDSPAQTAVLKEIAERHRNLEVEKKRLLALNENQTAQLRLKAENLDDEVKQIQKEIYIQEQRLRNLRQIAKYYDDLAQSKFVSEIQVRQKYDDAAEQETKLEALRRQQLQTVRELRAIKLTLPELQIKMQQQLADIERQLSVLHQEKLDRQDSQRKGNIAVFAPVDGIVTNVLVNRGQSLSESETICSIVPADSKLHAELLLPTTAAGFVTVGQKVTLRYKAFPFERFGHYTGVVTRLNRAALVPGEKTPLPINEPVYKVTVEIPSQYVRAHGNVYPLKVGMLLDADIALDRRRLYEWLLEPLYSAGGRI